MLNLLQLLAEKMHPGEDVGKAAIRGVKEELGEVLTDETRIEVEMESLDVSEEVVESASYPTLTTKYILHTIIVRVSGLSKVCIFLFFSVPRS